jgi:carboxylesterase type B
VYRYAFTHKPSSGIQTLGSYHAAELPFVFGTTPGGGLFPDSFTETEVMLSNAMIDQWTSFARSGQPDPSWPQYTLKTEATFIFNTSLVTKAPIVDLHYKAVCHASMRAVLIGSLIVCALSWSWSVVVL